MRHFHHAAGERAGDTVHRFRLGPATGVVSQVVFDPTGRYLVTANWNNTVYVLRVPTVR